MSFGLYSLSISRVLHLRFRINDMKSKFALVALLIVPILLVVFSILVYKNPVVKENEATNVNSNYMLLEEKWLTNRFEPLYSATNIYEKVRNLEIKFKNCEELASEKPVLIASISDILQSLCSETYEDYLKRRTFGKSYVIDTDSMEYKKIILNQAYSISDFPSDANDILRLFWEKVTNNGKDASLWQSVCWESSWIECQKVNDNESFKSVSSFCSFLKSKVPNCGLVGYASSFNYSPKREEVFDVEKQDICAIAFILIKTSEEKAYPLIFQFYWSPTTKAWLADYLAVGYIGSRKADPVF